MFTNSERATLPINSQEDNSLSDADMNFFADFLKSRSGIVIKRDKEYLVLSRLRPIAKTRNLQGNVSALINQLKTSRDEALAKELVEAMTTNESFFFRDGTPFTNLENHVVPELVKSRGTTKNLRIWCAACSSGQEPYSIAMLLENLKLKYPGYNFEIVATDIDNKILAKASAGVFSQFEVQRGLPIQYLIKHFVQTDRNWEISTEIKAKVKFTNFNLLDSMAILGKFDIVFCRNVLIYFDKATQEDILKRIKKQMNPKSFLFLGASETILNVQDVYSLIPNVRGTYLTID